MVFGRKPNFISRVISGLSISPRLILILLSYMIVVLFFVYALLSAPWLVVALSLLAAWVADHRAAIKRRLKALICRLRGVGGDTDRTEPMSF